MEGEESPESPTPPPDDLPELDPETLAAVRALQGGEVDESTRHLFGTFERQLKAFFRRRGCDVFEVDDLTQTVFIRMLDQIGSLREATSFHFWLFRIARNSLRNFVRDKARSRDNLEDVGQKARKDSEKGVFWVRGTFEPNPEAKLAMSETVERRRHVLRKLLDVTKLAPQTLQSLVRRLHGESFEEIARALEIPIGTARSHSVAPPPR
jgi:RNA polymerase sigma factor (sigma-70 family)